jgi:hypothetical protein
MCNDALTESRLAGECVYITIKLYDYCDDICGVRSTTLGAETRQGKSYDESNDQ